MRNESQYIVIKNVLACLNYAKLDNDLIKYVEILLDKVENEQILIDIVYKNSIHVLVYLRLKKYFFKTYQSISNIHNLQFLVRKYQKRYLIQNDYLKNFINYAYQENIKIVLLKGFCFSQCLYDEMYYKKMNDIDILVPEKDIIAVKNILNKLKFFCLIDDLFNEKKDSKKTYHSPPYISQDKNCVISMHWGLSHKINDTKRLQEIWNRIALIPSTINAYRMSWEDNLLHLCIHQPYYKIGFREFADIFNVIQFAEPKIDEKLFLLQVNDWHAQEAVYRVFLLVKRLFSQLEENIFVNSVISYTKPYCSKEVLKDTEKRLKSIRFLLNSRSTYISKIEKSFLLFRISKSYKYKFKIWLRMWYLLFCVPTTEVKIFSCYLGNNFITLTFCRIKAPFYILKSLCKDHGRKTVLFFTIGNLFWIIANTIKLNFIKKTKEQYDLSLFRLYKELE